MAYRCDVEGCRNQPRGHVDAGFLAPAHTCKQCSEEHCLMERYFAAQWRVAEHKGDTGWYVRHLMEMTSRPPQ